MAQSMSAKGPARNGGPGIRDARHGPRSAIAGRVIVGRHRHAQAQAVAGVVCHARHVLHALVLVLDVVAGDAALFALDLDRATAGAARRAVVLVHAAADRAADDRAGHGGRLAAIALAGLVAERAAD